MIQTRGSRRPASYALLIAPLLLLASPGPAAAPEPYPELQAAAGVAAPHEFHETYGNIAIEGHVVGGRFRFFKEQLEAALGPLLDSDAVDLRPGTEADALVLRYLRDHLTLEADGVALDLTMLDSGEEELGHHMGWWVIVQGQAPAPVERLRILNTLQFELFDDQRNMMRVVRLPGGTPETYYTAVGESEVVVAPVSPS